MSAVAACFEIAKAQRAKQGPASCVYVPSALFDAALEEISNVTGCSTSVLQVGTIWFYRQ
jgi:hypothetical protein